ncbi:hypothetical protein JMJ35_007191 [Cladonia borealis]|uniref:F-box domain-containing protein n=1 Tax=Cladonia borealis TaxID=184061 RepID=A0AA39QYQ8_9LECA|nr:hypothetical protein JMJ35_007191 [Cladonia borealis]
MDKIPVEIFEGICNVVDDRAALKVLRLVNKKSANIAERYLFKTLLVFQHMSSWHKVKLIAHSPRLAHLVKKLELVPITVSFSIKNYFEWMQRGQGRRVEDHLRLGHRGAAVAELVAPLTLNDEVGFVLGLLKKYENWLRWGTNREAIEYVAAIPWVPRTALSLPLPALSEIETAWPPDLRASDPHPGRREREGNLPLGIVDLFGSSNKRCNAHLSFALLALHDNGLKLTTLELHQYREILLDQIHPVPTLIHLKHLKLHFRHPFDVEHKQARAMADGAKIFEWTLAPYLANAENLENLTLTQDRFIDKREDECVWSYDIVPILSTASWPKLRSVWFGRIFTMSTYSPQFMMMHGKSLRTIHLDRPVSREIVWQLLASKIRTQCANPDCAISCTDDIIFHSKSADVKESDLSNSGYDWPGPEEHEAGSWAGW